jgi:hypothetical protein
LTLQAGLSRQVQTFFLVLLQLIRNRKQPY